MHCCHPCTCSLLLSAVRKGMLQRIVATKSLQLVWESRMSALGANALQALPVVRHVFVCLQVILRLQNSSSINYSIAPCLSSAFVYVMTSAASAKTVQFATPISSNKSYCVKECTPAVAPAPFQGRRLLASNPPAILDAVMQMEVRPFYSFLSLRCGKGLNERVAVCQLTREAICSPLQEVEIVCWEC